MPSPPAAGRSGGAPPSPRVPRTPRPGLGGVRPREAQAGARSAVVREVPRHLAPVHGRDPPQVRPGGDEQSDRPPDRGGEKARGVHGAGLPTRRRPPAAVWVDGQRAPRTPPSPRLALVDAPR